MIFNINSKGNTTPFKHYWEMCVGSCHAYTALREDYRNQLRKAHDELGFEYVRFHGLFNDDMGICKRRWNGETKSKYISYNFVNSDNIFEFLLSIGMKPFIELGFMPEALASGPKTCFHYKGNVTPPSDYEEWYKLVKAFTQHCVDRFGLEEVKTWYFEVWNEPNLDFFFDGTKEDYFELYKHSALAVKSVSEELRVGGPATSVNAWVLDMVNYCESNNVPLDFITTHHYPSDDPLWKNQDMSLDEFWKKLGHLMGTYERGILKKMTEKAREEAGKYPLMYTEWNTSAIIGEEQHDENYAAALVTKAIADNDGLVEAYSYWTFTDIFEENCQIPGEFHGGFGLQTYHGIKKPVYHSFELLHSLGTERLEVEGYKEGDTVEVVATKVENGLSLVAFNHNVPTGEIKAEAIEIKISGIDKVTDVTVRKSDEEHANAKNVWKSLGSPEYVYGETLKKISEKAELVTEKADWSLDGDILTIKVIMPEHSVYGFEVKF
ncbi:MAG: beta-xylosidase [Clostridia bacterium]|nr:beta-xylosidase [Clostridia bacterium]